MLVVGLTGGVASGKTTVSQLLQEEGAYVIDADQIARDLVQPRTPAWHEVVTLFGTQILGPDESIDRKKLAAIVFSSPQQRGLLEGAIHPRIREEVDRRVETIRRRDPEALVVVDAALLVETGGYRRMDRLIVVTATEAQQIERLRRRTGATEQEARGIISAQMALEEKIKVADIVLRNEGTIEETRKRVREIFQELKVIARDQGTRTIPVKRELNNKGGR